MKNHRRPSKFTTSKKDHGAGALMMLLILAITSIILVSIQYQAETIINSAGIINLTMDLKHLRAHIKSRVSCHKTIAASQVSGAKVCGGKLVSKQGDDQIFNYEIPPPPDNSDPLNPAPTCEENPYLYGVMRVGSSPNWNIAIQAIDTSADNRKIVIWAKPGNVVMVNGVRTVIDHPNLGSFVRHGSNGLFKVGEELCKPAEAPP